MKISVVCSSQGHPIYPDLEAWAQRARTHHEVSLVSKIAELNGGDLLLLISCGEIVTRSVRGLYCSTLVVHASDLPEGRGWSPHVWQVLEGKDAVTVTLLEAEDNVDTGKVWKKLSFGLEGHELFDEINKKLFKIELELMDFAVDHFGLIVPQEQENKKSSYYKKRTPGDSKIDPERSIVDQFNLLRVADSERFPAFFEHLGYKYSIKIEKIDL